MPLTQDQARRALTLLLLFLTPLTLGALAYLAYLLNDPTAGDPSGWVRVGLALLLWGWVGALLLEGFIFYQRRKSEETVGLEATGREKFSSNSPRDLAVRGGLYLLLLGAMGGLCYFLLGSGRAPWAAYGALAFTVLSVGATEVRAQHRLRQP